MPTSKTTFYLTAKIEIDPEGNFLAEVRKLQRPGDLEIAFKALGPVVWTERVSLPPGFVKEVKSKLTAAILKLVLEHKLKIFS